MKSLFGFAALLLLLLGCSRGALVGHDTSNGGAVVLEKTLVKASKTDFMTSLYKREDSTIEAHGIRQLDNVSRGVIRYAMTSEGVITDKEIIHPVKKDPFRSSAQIDSSFSLRDGGRLYYKSVRDEKYPLYRINLVRKDVSGAVLWETVLEGRETDKGRAGLTPFRVLEQENGDIIIAGHETQYDLSFKVSYVFFTRLDSRGKELWRAHADASNYPKLQGGDQLGEVVQLRNGDFIALGQHRLHRTPLMRSHMPLLIHVTASGEVAHRRTYFMDRKSVGKLVHISELAAGGYVLISNSSVIRLEDDFTTVWQKDFQLRTAVTSDVQGSVTPDIIIFKAETLDNGQIVLGGNIGSLKQKILDPFLMVIDEVGEPIWVRRYNRQTSRILKDMLIIEDDTASQAVLLLNDIPVRMTRERKRIHTTHLMKIDLTTPPVGDDGTLLGPNASSIKTISNPINMDEAKEIVERQKDLSNYTAKMTIQRATTESVTKLCQQLYAALPQSQEDLFIAKPPTPYEDVRWAPWGNKAPKLGALLDEVMPKREQLAWDKITDAAENRRVHEITGTYAGQKYYPIEGYSSYGPPIETMRWSERHGVVHDGQSFMALYDAAPPVPADYYKRYQVVNSDYVIYPGIAPNYSSVNKLRVYHDDKATRNYESFPNLDRAFYFDNKILYLSYNGLHVFDPKIAPNDAPYMRQYGGSNRHIMTGPFRQNQGCQFKFSVKVEQAAE